MANEEELRDMNMEVYKVDSNYKDNQNKIKYTDNVRQHLVDKNISDL